MEKSSVVEFVKRPIQMKKTIRESYYQPGGFFSHGFTVPEMAEYKTAKNLKEALELNKDGWYFEKPSFDDYFSDLAIACAESITGEKLL